MPYSDKALQESTLFELFKSEAYSDTEKALRLALAKIDAKILSIEGETWTKKRLKSTKRVIKDEILRAYGGLFGTLQGELPGIAEVTNKNTLGISFNKVPKAVLDKITSTTNNIQGYTFEDLFKTTSENHSRQLQVLLGSEVSQGKSANQIIRSIHSKNGKLTKGQLKNAVFTTITEARADVRYSGYSKLEQKGFIKGYEYVATLDSGTTEYCRDHDNNRYYQSIEEIQHLINVHFHCRSVFSPLTSTSTNTTRASFAGPVPDEPYSKWFKRQPTYFQKRVLKKDKFESYVTGTYLINSVADIRGKDLTLDVIDSTLEEGSKLDESL